MRGRRQGICLWAVALMVFSVVCHAQSVTPEDEYKNLIQVDQDIQPLGAHPFGENISLYDGTLSFEETDVSVPGNGPTIQLGRALTPASEVSGFVFGDWDLDIPRIETFTADQENDLGWQTVSSATLRCTDFGVPPTVSPSQPGGDPWSPDQWWYGYHLMMPGEGSQTLLQAATPKTIHGTSFSILTKQNWVIGCGVTANDGGEGFLAIAPDGTRYTFAQLVYRPMPALNSPLGTPPQTATMTTTGIQPMVAPFNILYRRDAVMYVTQVQDRFGNTLTYNYSGGNLTSIVGSDGRQVTLTYVSGTSLVQSVTVQASNATPRTWTYSYSGGTSGLLSGVQLPDGSAWSYQLSAFQNQIVATTGGDCQTDQLPVFSATTAVGTITHPSGLTAQFTLTPMLHGRSYVPKTCWGDSNTEPTGLAVYADIPNYSYQYSLTSEVVSGVGVPTEMWSYSYSPPNRSWTTDTCASTNSCPSSVYVDVTDPGGNDTRYTFSNRFDATDGQLQSTNYYNGSSTGTLMRSVANAYAGSTYYGFDLQDHDNTAQTEYVSPLNQRTITQDGSNYTWQAMAFDAYMHPTDVKRYNNIAGQSPIEETTTYLNDTNLWVLGLPQTVTNDGTGEVETSNTYTGLDELYTRSRFGELMMTYTWNSAGQLAGFEDGDSHTTSLSNYYRGIPQSIAYPDGTGESLVVDDLGQITSITDQAGHTTQYSYDPVGRIHTITYPYDSSIDSAQWYPKSFTYTPPADTPAERGLAAGHWRRTVTQGNDTDTTYFDAELRPVLDDSSDGSADISTATGYDWRGLTTFASYPVAGSPALSAITTGTHSTYDALGRLTQSQQDSELGLLTTTTNYVGGPGTQVTDPNGNVTTTYDQAFDQPVYNAPWSISAPGGVSQSITRDIYGEPTAITQSGSYGTETDSVTKTLIYDSYHRLCRTTEPETGSTVMAYDAANNLLWSAEGQSISGSACSQSSVPAAAQTVRSYDAMNRVLTIAPPAGTQSTTYTYDALGHVHTAVSGIASQGFAYNSLGALTSESLQVDGGDPWTLGYGYDAYGHRATVSYPVGTGTSEIVNYAPDAWGRPTQVGSYATGVGYFPNGQVQSFTYGNGTSYLAQQNARQLTSNFSDGAGSTLNLSEDLTYDADGNLTAVTDLASGLRTKSFGYDPLNRLTSATATNLYGTESYTYDPLNNLRTRLTQGQTLAYNYDATNKLTSITQGATSIDSFLYNPQGDTIGENSTTAIFDAKHQLTNIPGVESYSYDAAGRRVEKLPASGSPTYYFYDQAGQLMVQYAPGTATTTHFIYLGTRLVAQHDQVQLTPPGAISFGANPTDGGTSVSWGSVSAATSYTLEQSSDGGSSWGTVYGGSATSMIVSGLAGGGYVYRVQACISSTCSGWTTSATLEVWPAIPAVSVPTGTVNGPYPVSWTATAGATGYTVQESFNGGAWSTVATTTATSISRPGSTTGSYTYQVESSNTYGTAGWSATSAAVSVDTAFGTMPTPVPTLSVPAASYTGSATISWTAATPVTGYILQQSTDGGSTWTTVYSGTATSTALTGLTDGSYTYQLQACNNPADGLVCTAWVTGGTLVVTLPPASAPTLGVPASSGTGSYTVSWGSVATATSYTLQISSDGGSTWSTAYSGSATSWGASGQGDGSYTYQVQACNVGGCGPWSGTGTTTVLLPPASAPSLSVPASSTTGSYTVSWGTVSTATSYTLQLSIDSGGWSTVQSSAATSWGASGQGTGTYGYRVQACNASGCGPWSGTGTMNVLLPPGSAPSLSVPAGSPNGSYTVSWGSVATASSYTLQESANGGAWSTKQSGSATDWSTSGRGDGSYAYHVQACNTSGCGPWSGADTISVLLPPAAPAYLSVASPEYYPGPNWTVSWPASSTATSYTVQRTLVGSGVFAAVYTGSATTTTNYATPGTYQYEVQACNASGCSGWTSPVNVSVLCDETSAVAKANGVQPLNLKCN